jgi:MFS transporter, BCD family, chlorophyll transporter
MTPAGNSPKPFGWLSIIRLGLVQTALGAIVVLTTSTLNRVMVVELALPAMLPGALVALHYVVQLMRPRIGYGSDVGGRRTPWIVGGMAVLAIGGVLAAGATALMGSNLVFGVGLAVLAFLLIGLGVGSAGTSLLALLAKRVDPPRRAAAATVVWVMMIFGFAVTAGIAGKLLDPYSSARLLAVSAGVSLLAFALSAAAIRGIEGPVVAENKEKELQDVSQIEPSVKPSFREALVEVWAESDARRFTVFVFVSMLAYSAQDLILEPFAGAIYGFTPGESTKLSGLQHGGVLAGMILVAIAGSMFSARTLGSLRFWTVAGCVASAIAMIALAMAAWGQLTAPLPVIVVALGIANGAFSIAAIGSMMRLAAGGTTNATGREGMRMGLWGAAQAIAFGLGGFLGTVASDLARYLSGSAATGYGVVFAGEAVLFLFSAVIALMIGRASNRGAIWSSVSVTAVGAQQIAHLQHR